MRPFDWRPVLSEHRVPFIERGPNVKRGELNIRCPWCGSADPSFHLGISLETGWYSCWRNRQQHSGKSPVRLLMRLLGLGYEAAREAAGLDESYIDPEGFSAMAGRLLRPPDEPEGADLPSRSLAPDKYFVPITEAPLTRRFWNYLYGRGFDGGDIDSVCADYGLFAARHGQYAWRLVLPYYVAGEMVTWTARAIAPSSARYLDCPIATAITPAKRTLYNHDAAASGGRILVVVEGPLDALKLDAYGRGAGVRAVGLSTNSLTEDQVYLLEEASTGFDRVVIMMDNKTDFGLADSMRMRGQLRSSRFGIERVPFGRGDAAELTPREVRQWAVAVVG